LIAAVSVVGTLMSALAVTTISVRRAAISAKASGTDIEQPMSNVACSKYSSTLQALNGEYEASGRPVLLTIKTAPGFFYLVKLDEVTPSSPALLFFLQGGQRSDINIPVGEFRLKYAAGTHWCGDADLFGDDTVFNETDEALIFGRAGDTEAAHLTIELPLERHDKLGSKRISRSEFYGRR
jgi:hypothetical protein